MTGTIIKTLSPHGDEFLSVSSDIKAILPEALIEYLWSIALCGDWQKYDRQSVILKAAKLNGRHIQDIYHVCDHDNTTDRRRIYGIEPVNCNVQILNSNGKYQMQLREGI